MRPGLRRWKASALGLPLVLPGLALASIPVQVPDFRLAARLEEGRVELRALAPPGHHFNLRAPMVLEVDAPSSRRVAPQQTGERQLFFRIPGRQKTPLRVSAYLCDDANTFCEKRTLSAVWQPELRRLMVQTGR